MTAIPPRRLGRPLNAATVAALDEWYRVRDGVALAATPGEIARRHGITGEALRYYLRREGVPLAFPADPTGRLEAAVADWRRVIAGEVRETQRVTASRHDVTVQRLRELGLSTEMPDPASLTNAVAAWERVVAGYEPPERLGRVAERHGVAPSTMKFRVNKAGLPTCVPGLRRKGTTRRKLQPVAE